VCDIDEFEFVEYLEWVKARTGATVPAPVRDVRLARPLRVPTLPPEPIEA
jgi:hypothetical protein